MDGFKKVSEDKYKTVLKHENGHEITIAHAPLTGKMRGQLKSLPMAEGIKSKDSQSTTVATPTTQNFKGNNAANASVSQALAPDSAVLANGGKVLKQGNPKLEQSKLEPSNTKSYMAEGGNSAMVAPDAPTPDMAEGGKLDANARKHIASKNFAGPDKSYPIEDANHARNALARVSQHGSQELQAKVKAKVHAKYPDIEVSKMADGGQAQPTPAPTSTPTSSGSSSSSSGSNSSDYQVGEADSPGAKFTKYLQSKVTFADGGEVPSSAPADVAPSPDEGTASDRAMHIGSVIGHAVRTALGNAVDTAKEVAAPVVAGAKGLVQGATGADQPTPPPPPVDPQLAQAAQDLSNMQQPAPPVAQPTPDQSQATTPGTAGQSLPQPTDSPNLPGVRAADQPTLESGYANQVRGINQQAAAQGALGTQQAATHQQAASDEANALTAFQQHSSDLNQERQNFISDIQDGEIDPNHYMGNMDTSKKITTGIGLILGGIGGGLTHQANPALQMLNNNIDRDIDAQKTNLNSRQSLLSANLKQYGNLLDATNATRIMMNDIVGHKLDVAAANAQSPAAKAAALQAKGALQQQTAPMIYQLNMRRTLMGIGQGGSSPNGQPTASNLSSVDPAAFIHSVVPEDQQKAVAAEIERAQNTRHNASNIMSLFDQAVNDTKGLGRVGSIFKTPRSVQALHAALGPTFSDIEGTVRQAAMDNMNNNTTPANTDTDRDTAIKRNALQQYVTAKSSAPLAKANGIDLDKFESTNSSAMALLTPQQQSFAKWAQSNPNNPKAQLVLKKLGLK